MVKVAVVGIVKEEERDILEWVFYHSAAGADAVILYENGSDDRTFEIAKKATPHIDLRLFAWPERQSQLPVYQHAIDNFGDEFDWIAFIDSDEFLVPVRDGTIGNYLQTMDNHDAIATNWVCYGSSGHVAAPSGLIVENFCQRAPLDFSANRHVKSLIRPGVVRNLRNAHVANLVPPHAYVDVLGNPCDWIKPGKLQAAVGHDIMRVNHYFTRSFEHFKIKLARGNANKAPTRPDNFTEYDRNEERDAIIPERFPHVVQEIKSLMAQTRDDG